jgi:DNA invertase Pin-like site-specific DNA recombinase
MRDTGCIEWCIIRYMTEAEGQEALRASLRSWGRRRRRLSKDRDPLVRAALAAGITKTAIHEATGIGRMTIDRITKPEESPR